MQLSIPHLQPSMGSGQGCLIIGYGQSWPGYLWIALSMHYRVLCTDLCWCGAGGRM